MEPVPRPSRATGEVVLVGRRRAVVQTTSPRRRHRARSTTVDGTPAARPVDHKISAGPHGRRDPRSDCARRTSPKGSRSDCSTGTPSRERRHQDDSQPSVSGSSPHASGKATTRVGGPSAVIAPGISLRKRVWWRGPELWNGRSAPPGQRTMTADALSAGGLPLSGSSRSIDAAFSRIAASHRPCPRETGLTPPRAITSSKAVIGPARHRRPPITRS